MEQSELLIPNQIIKSKRKSISLIIKNNGDFFVRAPISSPDSHISKFINQKASWIIKKRTEQLENKIKKLSFCNAEEIYLHGVDYKLHYIETNRVKIVDNIIFVPKNNSKEKLISFLKKYAFTYISNRVIVLAQMFDFKYTSVSISSAKSCWGSCSFNNRLHFTYKLMFCPPEVIDYIIIHELCHTKIKNHSKEFWGLVKYCIPEFRNYENWLKQKRALVDII